MGGDDVGVAEGVAEWAWSRQSRMKAGIWTVKRKSAASLIRVFCLSRFSDSDSGWETPGENTSGLNLEHIRNY